MFGSTSNNIPPFKLEVIKHNPNDRRFPKMLYCKKEYDKKVKIADWHLNLEYQPIDTNPYNPQCFRLHNSHYDRLGNQNVTNPISETHDSLRKGITKNPNLEQDPHKYLVNVYTYDDCAYLGIKNPVPCTEPTAEYVTTMQSSYESPYPYVIKRLEAAVTENENRHMTSEEDCKFLDDHFQQFTEALQKTKGFRHVSFNPCTGKNTEVWVPCETEQINLN